MAQEVEADFPNVMFGVAPSILKEKLDDQLDTAYTRCSCHSGLVNHVQIVSTPPTPSNGCPITVFGKPAMPTRWMAGIAPHKSGRCRD